MTRVIEIRYAKQNTFTTDYEKFYIEKNTSDGGNYHLLKETVVGFRKPVIEPNGTFEDENLARLVLDYIETQRGYKKDTEHLYLTNAE